MHTEHRCASPPRPYRVKRRGARSPIANREADASSVRNSARYNRALHRAAHLNALVVDGHQKSEAVMTLLGKLRHHPEHRALWSATGRDAKDEDEGGDSVASEAACIEVCRELCEEICAELSAAAPRPDCDRLSAEEVESVLLN